MIDEIVIKIYKIGARDWWENGKFVPEKQIIPEIDMDILVPLNGTKARKLKAKWSPELTQDLNAYHGLVR